MINGFPRKVYDGQLQSVVFSYPEMDQPPIIWFCNDNGFQLESDVIKENLYETSDEASDYASVMIRQVKVRKTVLLKSRFKDL